MSQKPRNNNGQLKENVPDPEVVPRAKRRQFSTAYKLRVLEEADQCRDPGEIGSLLRREGLYSSHLSRWRQLRSQEQLGQGQRGRKANPQAAEVAKLQRENERLKARLEQAELVIDVQKKLSRLLGLNQTQRQTDESE